MESAHRASDIHKERTGRALRITEEDVINEDMYEEEEADLPMQYQRLTAHLRDTAMHFRTRLNDYVSSQVAMRTAVDPSQQGMVVQDPQNPPNLQIAQVGQFGQVPIDYLGEMEQMSRLRQMQMQMQMGLSLQQPTQPYIGQASSVLPSPMLAQHPQAQAQYQPLIQPPQHAPYQLPSAQGPELSPCPPETSSSFPQPGQEQHTLMYGGNPMDIVEDARHSAHVALSEQLELDQTDARVSTSTPNATGATDQPLPLEELYNHGPINPSVPYANHIMSQPTPTLTDPFTSLINGTAIFSSTFMTEAQLKQAQYQAQLRRQGLTNGRQEPEMPAAPLESLPEPPAMQPSPDGDVPDAIQLEPDQSLEGLAFDESSALEFGEPSALEFGELSGLELGESSALELSEPLVPELGEPSDLEPSEPSVMEPGEHSVMEPGEPSVLEPGEPSVLEPGEPLGLEPGEPLGLEPGEPSGMELGEPPVLELGEPSSLELGEPSTLKPESWSDVINQNQVGSDPPAVKA